MPSASAASKTGQKPRSSGAPDSDNQATPARNRTKGARAPAAPPWKRSESFTGKVWAGVSVRECNGVTER